MIRAIPYRETVQPHLEKRLGYRVTEAKLQQDRDYFNRGQIVLNWPHMRGRICNNIPATLKIIVLRCVIQDFDLVSFFSKYCFI